MALQALLLSRDPETVRVVRHVLDDLNIFCEGSTEPNSAIELLSKRRFDAVVIDCDDLPGAPKVLHHIRHAASNKRALAFAVVSGTTTVRQAFDFGANFVIDKPLTVERVLRSFRAADGLMKREHRRYFRNPLRGEAAVALPDGKQVRAKIINLSEGGMALQKPAGIEIKISTPVRLRFDLPNGSGRIEAKGEVSWMDRTGIGMRFLHIEQKMQRELEHWLAQQVDNHRSSPVFINATLRAR